MNILPPIHSDILWTTLGIDNEVLVVNIDKKELICWYFEGSNYFEDYEEEDQKAWGMFML